jgi:hypothetical protein
MLTRCSKFWHSGWAEATTGQGITSGAVTNPGDPNAGALVDASSLLDIVELSLPERKSEWIFFRELRVRVGRGQNNLQRLDAFAFNCFPHLGMKRVCYEVKTSRADFLCEMKSPLKRRIGMHLSNECFFVTPAGLLA